jgi:CBS domain-containing protein
VRRLRHRLSLARKDAPIDAVVGFGAPPVEHVSDILDEKGREVLSIEGDATVFDAIRRMVEANVGSLLVFEERKLAGIVTERDYLRRVALEGRTEKETAVREIMSAPLVYVTPETSLDECMAVMTERRIRHLPVLTTEREVAGVVSIGDLVKYRSKRQDVQIRLLTDYISSA